jgi:hypothetical protein
MCIDCAAREVLGIGDDDAYDLDRVPWPPMTRAMGQAATLVMHLYRLPGCENAGGPLHVVADDFNVEDHHLKFERDWLDRADEADYYGAAWPEIRRTAEQILDLFDGLNRGQRATVLAYAHGDLPRHTEPDLAP